MKAACPGRERRRALEYSVGSISNYHMIKGAGDVYFSGIDLEGEGGMLLLSDPNAQTCSQIAQRDELAENTCHACQRKLLTTIIFQP